MSPYDEFEPTGEDVVIDVAGFDAKFAQSSDPFDDELGYPGFDDEEIDALFAALKQPEAEAEFGNLGRLLGELRSALFDETALVVSPELAEYISVDDTTAGLPAYNGDELAREVARVDVDEMLRLFSDLDDDEPVVHDSSNNRVQRVLAGAALALAVVGGLVGAQHLRPETNDTVAGVLGDALSDDSSHGEEPGQAQASAPTEQAPTQGPDWGGVDPGQLYGGLVAADGTNKGGAANTASASTSNRGLGKSNGVVSSTSKATIRSGGAPVATGDNAPASGPVGADGRTDETSRVATGDSSTTRSNSADSTSTTGQRGPLTTTPGQRGPSTAAALEDGMGQTPPTTRTAPDGSASATTPPRGGEVSAMTDETASSGGNVSGTDTAPPVNTAPPVDTAPPVETTQPVQIAPPAITAPPVNTAPPVETAQPVETTQPVQIAPPVIEPEAPSNPEGGDSWAPPPSPGSDGVVIVGVEPNNTSPDQKPITSDDVAAILGPEDEVLTVPQPEQPIVAVAPPSSDTQANLGESMGTGTTAPAPAGGSVVTTAPEIGQTNMVTEPPTP